MYFLMVLFFALQITLLIFCLGIFIKKMCCENFDEDFNENQTNINLGNTSDNNTSYDEKVHKILKYLKNPSNADNIVFSPAPDSPLVNNWVGDGVTDGVTDSNFSLDSSSAKTGPRSESEMSLKSADSQVSVSVISDGGSSDVTAWSCPICLNANRSLTVNLPCKHSYHKACLKDFVVYSLEHGQSFRCPICRCQLQINIDYKNSWELNDDPFRLRSLSPVPSYQSTPETNNQANFF